MGGRKYTEQEIAYVKAQYANEYNCEIAKHLGRSINAVNNIATVYGLRKSKAFKSRQGAEAAAANYDEIKKGWFAKGSTPHNKGKKLSEFMSTEGIERSKVTRFCKGQAPHNTKHNGAITWRKDNTTAGGYYYIRIEKAKWLPLHRYLYEQAYGPIPTGYNVQFKDGNSRHCWLSNLELVSKAKNMLKNTISQWPEPIKENIKLINKINKIIKSYETRK